jgi:site-specific DNA-cytosine methylase
VREQVLNSALFGVPQSRRDHIKMIGNAVFRKMVPGARSDRIGKVFSLCLEKVPHIESSGRVRNCFS